MSYIVCGMEHIKDHLLLANQRIAHVVAATGFLSYYLYNMSEAIFLYPPTYVLMFTTYNLRASFFIYLSIFVQLFSF